MLHPVEYQNQIWILWAFKIFLAYLKIRVATFAERSRVSSPDCSTHSVRLLFKAPSLIEIARANPSLVRKLTMNLPESFPVSASPFGISSLANALRILEAVLTVLTAAPACVRHQSSIAEVAVERSVSPARLSANIVADFLTAMCKERECGAQSRKFSSFQKRRRLVAAILALAQKAAFRIRIFVGAAGEIQRNETRAGALRKQRRGSRNGGRFCHRTVTLAISSNGFSYLNYLFLLQLFILKFWLFANGLFKSKLIFLLFDFWTEETVPLRHMIREISLMNSSWIENRPFHKPLLSILF